MAKTAGTTTPRKSKGRAPAGPKIVRHSTAYGYSYIVFAEGRGDLRRYWWHCAACWGHCADDPVTTEDDVEHELSIHLALCPRSLHQTGIQIVWADGHPTTTVKI